MELEWIKAFREKRAHTRERPYATGCISSEPCGYYPMRTPKHNPGRDARHYWLSSRVSLATRDPALDAAQKGRHPV